MPLTPNGKVDRSRCRSLASTRALAPSTWLRRTSVESSAGRSLERGARRRAIGVRDDFFALGGHSLLATMLVSRVRDTFAVAMSVGDVFAAPVLGDQARGCQDQRPEAPAAPIPVVARQLSRVPGIEDEVFVLPASFAEQRLWFLEELDARGGTYDIGERLRLTGPLDMAVLERSLNALVARHESLRTTFEVLDGSLARLVRPRAHLPLAYVDVSQADDPAAQAQAWLDARARERFDLRRGPLVRAGVARVAAEEHILSLDFHHAITDEWSGRLIRGELSELYSAGVEGRVPRLGGVAVQYGDFAAWQVGRLERGELSGELAFWVDRLAGAPALLDLPGDFPRPERQSFRGGRCEVMLGAGLSARVRELGAGLGATPFMTLLAAFAGLLARYSGQEDLVIATPVAGRDRVQLEDVVGFFVNTVALRQDLSGDPSFAQLVERVKSGALAAFAHQELPFEQVVEALAPQRHLSYSPVAQVMFNYQVKEAGLALAGLQAAPVALGAEVAKFDLTLHALDGPEGVRLSLEYASDLFARESIERMLGHLVTLLDSVTGDPELPVSRAALLSEAERRQLIEHSGPAPSAYPRRCVHELISATAARCGERVAVQCGESELSYAELERRANQLAHRLGELGVGPEVSVAVCLERSVDVVVALLGVLKAGGAYVPIDPGYPAARQALMRSDSDARVLICHQRLAPDDREGVLCSTRRGRRCRATRPRRPLWTTIPSSWPTSSTPRAPPAPPKASRSPTARWSTSSGRSKTSPRWSPRTCLSR